MIYISTVYALDDLLSGVTKSGDDLHGIFIDTIGHEILSQCTIVTIGHLLCRVGLWLFLWKTTTVIQVFYVHEIYVSVFVSIAFIAWYQPTENLFSEESWANSQVMLRVF